MFHLGKPENKLDRAVDGTPSQIPTLLAEIALVPHSIVLSNQAKFYLYVILLIIPFNLICHMTMLWNLIFDPPTTQVPP